MCMNQSLFRRDNREVFPSALGENILDGVGFHLIEGSQRIDILVGCEDFFYLCLVQQFRHGAVFELVQRIFSGRSSA